MDNYSILINTCDKFEDCWDPFFKLFSIYWPDYNGKIYLNTEYKDYSFGNLNIIPLKVCVDNQDTNEITWSECLIRALNKIDGKVILYMQEDYFLKDIVKNEIVQKYGDLINEHTNIHCIHLTDQAVKPLDKSQYTNLMTVVLKQRYRISCQAALWKKDVLLSYLRTHENAWQFEEFGSKRASKVSHNFFVVDNKFVTLNQYELIPYIFTGIVQGRWNNLVVALFNKHQISIDYTKRGFLNEAKPKPLKRKVEYHLKKISIIIKNYWQT